MHATVYYNVYECKCVSVCECISDCACAFIINNINSNKEKKKGEVNSNKNLVYNIIVHPKIILETNGVP